MHAYGVCPIPPAPQPRWAAQHSFQSAHVAFLALGARDFCVCEVEAVSLPSVYSAYCRNARCPFVKTTNFLFP